MIVLPNIHDCIDSQINLYFIALALEFPNQRDTKVNMIKIALD